jgi:hypothetical protein
LVDCSAVPGLPTEHRTILILQTVALEGTYSSFTDVDRYRYANRLGDTASKREGTMLRISNTSISLFKLKEIGAGEHIFLLLHQNKFRSANCSNLYSNYCKQLLTTFIYIYREILNYCRGFRVL